VLAARLATPGRPPLLAGPDPAEHDAPAARRARAALRRADLHVATDGAPRRSPRQIERHVRRRTRIPARRFPPGTARCSTNQENGGEERDAPGGRRVADQGEDDPAFLPPGYRVAASMGHVRDLPESPARSRRSTREGVGALGVNVEQDFQPLYVVPGSKKKVVGELRTLLKDATS
jgi:hypothetical protein